MGGKNEWSAIYYNSLQERDIKFEVCFRGRKKIIDRRDLAKEGSHKDVRIQRKAK
jgi:hypothetical protein